MSTRTYGGPVYPGPFRKVKDVNQFCEWLVKQKPLPGARIGNSPTNVGETIEAAGGLEANTRTIDFDELEDGRVELKSGRLGKKTPTTLGTRVFDSFTGEPYPAKSRSARFAQLVEEFAIPTTMTIQMGPKKGETGIRKNLTGIDLTDSPHPKTGLYLELSEDERRMCVCHGQGKRMWFCPGQGNKKRELGFYDQEDTNVIQHKLKSQYYVEAEEIDLGGGRYAYDVKSVEGWSYKLERLTPKRLFEYIVSDKFILQIRAHICDDFICRHGTKGTPCIRWRKYGPGRVRDHGTGIRITPAQVTKVFERRKIA